MAALGDGIHKPYCHRIVAQCFVVISYRYDMFRLQLTVIFRELASLSTCVADVGEIPQIRVKPQL